LSFFVIPEKTTTRLEIVGHYKQVVESQMDAFKMPYKS